MHKQQSISQKLKRLSKFDWLTIFLISFACICLTTKTLQNDTFYLIKIGEYISKNGLDFKDHYTWVANLSYEYPHFLLNLLLYSVYSIANLHGIYIVTIILYIIYGLSIFYILRKLIKTPILPNILSLLSVILISTFITARSQTITYSLFAWEIYYIISLLKTGQQKYIFLLVIQSWLVALTHALTWPIVFIFYLPFIVSILITKILKRSTMYKNRKEIKTLSNKLLLLNANETNKLKLIFFALTSSFLIGLLTPARICYTGFIKISLGDTQSYIAEHQPLTLIHDPNAIIYLLAFLCVLIFTKAKLRLDHFFLATGLIILSFLAVRHTALLITIGFIPLSYLLKNLFSQANSNFFTFINNNLPKRLILFTTVALLSLSFIDNLRNPYLDEYFCPIKATNFIKNNVPINNNSFRLFNEYNIGAYLLYEEVPIFIDSRAEIYTKQYTHSERDYFNDYRQILTASAYSNSPYTESFSDKNYEELINDYEITHFLLYKTTPLAKVLRKDQNYKELYSDELFIFFEKVS